MLTKRCSTEYQQYQEATVEDGYEDEEAVADEPVAEEEE